MSAPQETVDEDFLDDILKEGDLDEAAEEELLRFSDDEDDLLNETVSNNPGTVQYVYEQDTNVAEEVKADEEVETTEFSPQLEDENGLKSEVMEEENYQSEISYEVNNDDDDDDEEDEDARRTRFRTERQNVITLNSKKRRDIPDNLDSVVLEEETAKVNEFLNQERDRRFNRGRGNRRGFFERQGHHPPGRDQPYPASWNRDNSNHRPPPPTQNRNYLTSYNPPPPKPNQHAAYTSVHPAPRTSHSASSRPTHRPPISRAPITRPPAAAPAAPVTQQRVETHPISTHYAETEPAVSSSDEGQVQPRKIHINPHFRGPRPAAPEQPVDPNYSPAVSHEPEHHEYESVYEVDTTYQYESPETASHYPPSHPPPPQSYPSYHDPNHHHHPPPHYQQPPAESWPPPPPPHHTHPPLHMPQHHHEHHYHPERPHFDGMPPHGGMPPHQIMPPMHSQFQGQPHHAPPYPPNSAPRPPHPFMSPNSSHPPPLPPFGTPPHFGGPPNRPQADFNMGPYQSGGLPPPAEHFDEYYHNQQQDYNYYDENRPNENYQTFEETYHWQAPKFNHNNRPVARQKPLHHQQTNYPLAKQAPFKRGPNGEQIFSVTTLPSPPKQARLDNRNQQQKNIKEVPIVDTSSVLVNQPAVKKTMPAEDEDEETKDLRLKLEEQKRIREENLRKKEARRVGMAAQRMKELNERLAKQNLEDNKNAAISGGIVATASLIQTEPPVLKRRPSQDILIQLPPIKKMPVGPILRQSAPMGPRPPLIARHPGPPLGLRQQGPRQMALRHPGLLMRQPGPPVLRQPGPPRQGVPLRPQMGQRPLMGQNQRPQMLRPQTPRPPVLLIQRQATPRPLLQEQRPTQGIRRPPTATVDPVSTPRVMTTNPLQFPGPRNFPAVPGGAALRAPNRTVFERGVSNGPRVRGPTAAGVRPSPAASTPLSNPVRPVLRQAVKQVVQTPPQPSPVLQGNATLVRRMVQIPKTQDQAQQQRLVRPPQGRCVLVSNLSASTTENQLKMLAKSVGPIESINLNKKESKSEITFCQAAHAAMFQQKFLRYMLDLSLIQVSML